MALKFYVLHNTQPFRHVRITLGILIGNGVLGNDELGND